MDPNRPQHGLYLINTKQNHELECQFRNKFIYHRYYVAYHNAVVADPDPYVFGIHGSACFWTSWIQIRILLSSSKNSKKKP